MFKKIKFAIFSGCLSVCCAGDAMDLAAQPGVCSLKAAQFKLRRPTPPSEFKVIKGKLQLIHYRKPKPRWEKAWEVEVFYRAPGVPTGMEALETLRDITANGDWWVTEVLDFYGSHFIFTLRDSPVPNVPTVFVTELASILAERPSRHEMLQWIDSRWPM